MANGHLYKYEFDFQENKTKHDPKVAKYLSCIFRYIDDISPINDNGCFDQYRAEIYPKELKLTKENEGTRNANVLDIDMKIKDRVFELGVYDKTE